MITESKEQELSHQEYIDKKTNEFITENIEATKTDKLGLVGKSEFFNIAKNWFVGKAKFGSKI